MRLQLCNTTTRHDDKPKKQSNAHGLMRLLLCPPGPNDNSRHMANIIDSDEQVRAELESPKFVAINIKSGTEAYTQFAQICE